jgi:hypothetical protein
VYTLLINCFGRGNDKTDVIVCKLPDEIKKIVIGNIVLIGPKYVDKPTKIKYTITN